MIENLGKIRQIFFSNESNVETNRLELPRIVNDVEYFFGFVHGSSTTRCVSLIFAEVF